jgi:DnaJ-class molecular chaperone
MNDIIKMKTKPNNPWTILGLQPGADFTAIKAAYKQLAQKHHPDKGGKVSDWLAISDAYETLKKKKYVPILEGPSTQMLDIKLSIQQQIQGLDDIIRVEDEDELFVKVKIPPGAKTGDRFRVERTGKNYIINIKELAHSFFTRDGNHLILYKTIHIADVLRRRPLIIESATGEYIEVALPNDIQTGTIIVVPEQGLFNRKTHKRGNLRIHVKIELPIITDDNVEELITRLKNDRY